MSSSTFERRRQRRTQAAGADLAALASGSVDRLMADIDNTLVRERARRESELDKQASSVAEVLESFGDQNTWWLHRLGSAETDVVNHVALTPSGVWVTAMWQEPGARVEVVFSGGPGTERLMVRGRDSSDRVQALSVQQRAVRRALAAYDVPVRGIMVFPDAQLPTIWAPIVGDFPVADAELAREELTAPGPVDDRQRLELRRVLRAEFPLTGRIGRPAGRISEHQFDRRSDRRSDR